MDVDVDQDLLTMFSCLGTTDKDVLVADLQTIVGSQLSREGCVFFLEMTNWNLNAAVGAYYDYYQPAYQPPEMSLVDDVTIGNGESIAPSTHFNKTWRVRNSGREPWPWGVYLSLRCGDRMNGPSVLPLPSLQSGEEANVSVSLQSPAVPGVYQSQWRMCKPNGTVFGETLWAVVCVEEGGVMGLTQQMSAISTQDGATAEGMTQTTTEQPLNPFASPHSSPGFDRHSVPGSDSAQLTSPQSMQAPDPHSIQGFNPHSVLSSSPQSIPSLLAPPSSPRSILLHGDGIVSSNASDVSLQLRTMHASPTLPSDFQGDRNMQS